MKKITSQDPITFAVDGATILEIGPDGCLATDAAAAIAKDRLGEHITVEDTSVEQAVEDATTEELSLSDLKAKAKDLGLAVSGSKADLTERIAAHEATQETATTEAVVTPAEETPAE